MFQENCPSPTMPHSPHKGEEKGKECKSIVIKLFLLIGSSLVYHYTHIYLGSPIFFDNKCPYGNLKYFMPTYIYCIHE
jgi:hypothetical protein